ncbi:MAG: nucleotidyltransferase domain-containing protein [Rivularia sp. (in: cyanobacteria)]|jgi:hypothetical protein
MPEDRAFNNYLIDEILEIVKNWAEIRSEILALALVGSYARGEATADSDIDLMLIAYNTEFFRQNYDWMYEINWESINYKILTFDDAQYGAVWSRHIYLNRYKTKYSTNLKIEISFGLPRWASIDPIDSGTFAVVSRGCKILYDSQGILTNLMSKL